MLGDEAREREAAMRLAICRLRVDLALWSWSLEGGTIKGQLDGDRCWRVEVKRPLALWIATLSSGGDEVYLSTSADVVRAVRNGLLHVFGQWGDKRAGEAVERVELEPEAAPAAVAQSELMASHARKIRMAAAMLRARLWSGWGVTVTRGQVPEVEVFSDEGRFVLSVELMPGAWRVRLLERQPHQPEAAVQGEREGAQLVEVVRGLLEQAARAYGRHSRWLLWHDDGADIEADGSSAAPDEAAPCVATVQPLAPVVALDDSKRLDLRQAAELRDLADAMERGEVLALGVLACVKRPVGGWPDDPDNDDETAHIRLMNWSSWPRGLELKALLHLMAERLGQRLDGQFEGEE